MRRVLLAGALSVLLLPWNFTGYSQAHITRKVDAWAGAVQLRECDAGELCPFRVHLSIENLTKRAISVKCVVKSRDVRASSGYVRFRTRVDLRPEQFKIVKLGRVKTSAPPGPEVLHCHLA